MAASYKLMMIGVLALIVGGLAMASYGYQISIYPVDSGLGNLARAESAQTPEELANYVIAAKRELPKSGNPVWSFPTPRTDFGLHDREQAEDDCNPHDAHDHVGRAHVHVRQRLDDVLLYCVKGDVHVVHVRVVGARVRLDVCDRVCTRYYPVKL